ncbi:porin [Burkholderia multivorans]|uniref:porin n=1 Tax=Burkholderia multivorans TaxID=87883 RepID=UPI002158D2F6|nr:porin [Burkholderia multivorans]MDR9177587.1 Outer membrane porin protein [Burkholderia multivorans]MDR9179237.1 Outer membrane porin protein [Burkholderia multivorans]MDR9186291.1 Outer membrane porin protein [Burkholderia multivorans]MDR9191496.1 Outer membrane porin protein [Burkholderia multivorans]MDR9200053.1 Outer membrane porin protein [Burkholderia multivorans]
MRKWLFSSSLGILLVSPVVHAQSSVTLYGIIDDGLTWSSNQGGHSAWQMHGGISQGSRWGMKGVEDLGGGWSAVFRLENGFNVNTGALSQGGRLFGRQAYVGIANSRYGTVTLGRQGEAVGDYIGTLSANGMLPGGILFPHPGDLDNNGIDFRLNNTVKYTSPTIAGLTGVAMYSFGGVAGDFGRTSAKSFALQYAYGGLQMAAAYTSIDHPAQAVPEGLWTASNTVNGNYGLAAASYKVVGIGAAYTFGRATISADWTHTRFGDLDPKLGAKIGGHATFDIGEIVGVYRITPTLQLGLAYSYTAGNVSQTGYSPGYHEGDASIDYLLSVRTDVYATATYMHATGGAVANLGPVLAASSSPNQLALRIGIRHKF